MDMNLIINIVLGVALSVGGWFVRQMWDAVQNLKSDIQRIEVVGLPSFFPFFLFILPLEISARVPAVDSFYCSY